MVGKYSRRVNTWLAISYAPRNKQGHLSIKEYHDYYQRIEKGRDDYITYYSRYTGFIFMNLIFCLCMFIWCAG